jgi:hypothetical protein
MFKHSCNKKRIKHCPEANFFVMSSPRQNPNQSQFNQSGNTASSFGESDIANGNRNGVDQRREPISEIFLSTQLSLGTISVEGRSPFPRIRRGDVIATGALEKYLASDISTNNAQVENNLLSSAADFNIPPPMIWGTTVTLEESMSMFRDFITNFSIQGEPYYDALLSSVGRYLN